VLWFLAGCGAISSLDSASKPLSAYMLEPAAPSAAVPTRNVRVVVESSTASGALDTDRILIKPNALQAEYLAGARWIDPAPRLVQELLVGSLRSTGAFAYVGTNPAGSFPDYTVLTDLRAFQAEVDPESATPTVVRTGFDLTVIREIDGNIAASRRFTASAGIAPPGTDPLQVVAAFNAATDAALREAVGWLLGTLHSPGS
jgi:cholesterol transport system auxiliary component